MSWKPETHDWPETRAVLFVHGVGDSSPGDYDDMIQNFKAWMGTPLAGKLALYFLYYDDVNDWINEKTRLASMLKKLKDALKSELDNSIAEAAGEFGGDVLFPVLIEANRIMVRDRLLAQVMQMRLDGKRSGVRYADQKISIICHSLGCFHTYEMLHVAATDTDEQLQPITNNMVFENVLFMASPVQLIRSVAGKLGGLVPAGLATLNTAGLFIPYQKFRFFGKTNSVKNWVSITGNQDPIGGHILKKKLDWAYMNVPGQDSYVDDQSLLNLDSPSDWAGTFSAVLSDGAGASLPMNNPHSWKGYIDRHQTRIQQWLGA